MGEERSSFRPIFVVGAGRSGTTLLAELLGRHSQISMPPETQFFVAMKNLGVDVHEQSTHEQLLGLLPRLRKLSESQLPVEEIAAPFRRCPATAANLFRAAIEAFCHRHGKTRPGEKTPNHLYHVPTLVRSFPDSRIVAIVRDPRDMAASYLNVPFGPPTVAEAAVYWRLCAQQLLEHQANYRSHLMVVRYEDLLADPQAQLQTIDRFLDVPFEARQLDPTVSTAVFVTREQQWKRKVKQPIDAARAFAWQREMDVASALQVTAIVEPYLSTFGYDDSPLRRCGLVRRWRMRAQAAQVLRRLQTPVSRGQWSGAQKPAAALAQA